MTQAPAGPFAAEPSTETGLAGHRPQMTGQAVSELIGVSPTWIAKLEEQGFVRRLENRKFDVIDALLGYVRWLKDPARRTTKTEGAKRTDELRNRKLEISIAKELDELVDLETVEEAFLAMFTVLRNEIGATPAGVTRDLELRANIETYLNGAFSRCRAAFDTLQQALRAGCVDLDSLNATEP